MDEAGTTNTTDGAFTKIAGRTPARKESKMEQTPKERIIFDEGLYYDDGGLDLDAEADDMRCVAGGLSHDPGRADRGRDAR
mgnify:CR=1 FL=1